MPTYATINAPVAIVGFGTAGYNAALAMRTSGYTGPIQVFSNISTLPYSPILTSYYAGNDKDYEECFPWSAEEIGSLGLEVMNDCPVTGMDVDAHKLTTPKGEFAYSKCVLATGASPTSFGFPQDCGYEPIMLRTMDDAERLRECISSEGCKRVLVSGASMVALKMLEACLHHGCDVTLVGMNPNVLDFNALPPAAERFERGLEAKGVKLRLGQVIKNVEVVEDPAHPLGRKLHVEFSQGDTEDFDEICVAHGMQCNLDFLPDEVLAMEKALVVDEFMRTSDPDVYAAGDIVQAKELTSGQSRVIGIWKNAAVQGQCAGHAVAVEMAGAEPGPAVAYKGSISSNTIAVDGTLFLSGGSIELGLGRTMEVRETEDMTVVYIYEGSGDSKRLVGFNVASDIDVEGGVAYDTAAMLTLRIERACR